MKTITKRYVKSLQAAIERHKKAVAKHRDELRDLLEDAESVLESEDGALEDLHCAVDKLKALGPEPLGEYMKAQGFDPEKGGRMMLPASLKREFSPVLMPHYVAFAEWVEQPILYWNVRQYLGSAVFGRSD